MDQLKPYLEQAYKYRFWIICGTVLTLSLVFSFLAASSMRADTKKQISTIEAAFSNARTLGTKADPPNDASHKAMQAKIDEVKEGVRLAWEIQYNYQNEGPNKLEWPAPLGADFINQVTPLHPIEKIPYPTPSDQEILDFYRINYRNYIKKELPLLSAMIGAKWHPASEFVDEEEEDDSKKYVVEWVAGNQTFLQDSRFDWGNAPPSTLDVLYSQEDLWVLRTLLQVVKDTNGPVEARYKAAIKQINSILLGQDVTAMQDDATLREPGSNATSADGDMSGMAMSMEMSMDDGSGDMDSSSSSSSGNGNSAESQGTRQDPLHMRYVDTNFNGVSAKTARDALTSNDPKLAEYAVAKRIPVRIQMSIDQRRLNKFLTLCGNAPLQIEIKRVRINRKSSANPTAAGGGGGGMEMGMGDMTEFEGPSMDMEDAMGEFGGGPTNQVTKLTDESPFDVDVEIYGMVYIYNPVDLDRLGIDKVVPEDVPATDEANPADVDNNQNAAAPAVPENPQAS